MKLEIKIISFHELVIKKFVRNKPLANQKEKQPKT